MLPIKVFAQCISVELSVYWTKGEGVFANSDSIDCLPFLKISYRNNSEIPFYFLKISQGREGLPQITRSTRVMQKALNESFLSQALNHGNKYKVELGASNNYLNAWEIILDTLNLGKEHEIDAINDDLADIYDCILIKTSPKYTNLFKDAEIKLHYSKLEITEDGILKSINDHFVFLDPGEIYTESYNLIGFQKVGGSFTFVVNQNEMENFVYTEPVWDDKQTKYSQTRAYLPEKVGKYKLFYGDFYSNETTISFSNKSNL